VNEGEVILARTDTPTYPFQDTSDFMELVEDRNIPNTQSAQFPVNNVITLWDKALFNNKNFLPASNTPHFCYKDQLMFRETIAGYYENKMKHKYIQ
jgi:hypothetical protein